MATPTSPPRFHGLILKNLTPRDVDAAQVLILQAGWNQVREDWEFMITSGEAIGLFADGKLVATAVTLPYGSTFAWISMVLIDDAWRRKGLATGLLRHCIDVICDRGMVPVLDATEAGRLVYQPLGFEDVYSLSRLQSVEAGVVPGAAQFGEGWTPRAMTKANLDELAAWDGKRFGENRGPLLRAMWHRSRNFAQIAIASNGAIGGYILGRNGRAATHIGPLIAKDEKIAISLIKNALAQIDGPRIIDIPDHQFKLRDWLERAGFNRQRGFIRMALGRSRPFDNRNETFAIAGPELG